MLEGILSKAPKLESGDYGDLVRALKKVRIILFCLWSLNIYLFFIYTFTINVNIQYLTIFFLHIDYYKRYKCYNCWYCC